MAIGSASRVLPAGRAGLRIPRSALLLLFAGACGRAPDPGHEMASAPAAVPVRLASIHDTTIDRPVVATGTLGAKQDVPLGFKIGGVVERVLVEEGQVVQAGQLLATLSQPEIAGAVAKAEAGVAQAARDLARATALYADSVVPRAAWEGAGTALDVAQADLRIARFNQQYAVIRAPGAGTVLRRLVEPGQQIAAGTPALMLATAGRGQVVRAGLSDRDVARLAVGDQATIRVEAATGDAPLAARVSRIAAAATPGSGTWEVELRPARTLRAPAGGMASGLIAEVVILPARVETVVLVPLAALLQGEGDSGVVYTVGRGPDNRTVARRHAVEVGFIHGATVAVRGGLDGAAEVVAEGAPYLTDGAVVAVTARDGAP